MRGILHHSRRLSHIKRNLKPGCGMTKDTWIFKGGFACGSDFGPKRGGGLMDLMTRIGDSWDLTTLQ
jgi:hypothetical protein